MLSAAQRRAQRRLGAGERDDSKRKRERATLDAFEDLVRYLRTLREERKAILTVTEGWMLYGENRAITKLREDPVTGYRSRCRVSTRLASVRTAR